jgi:hypothetical protein
MSILGSSWKEEEPTEDEIRKFRNVTGEEFHGSKKDLEKRITKIKDSNWTSSLEKKRLSDLEDDLNPKTY